MESEAKTVILVSPAMTESDNANWRTAHHWAQFSVPVIVTLRSTVLMAYATSGPT